MEVIISAVVYGETVLPESMVFPGGLQNILYPIVFGFYYIQKAGRQILVDAGCDTMPGFKMRNFVSPVKALEEICVRPDEITDVIITHAHHDHIDGVCHFPNAVIHIQEDEYRAGRSYIPENFQVRTFRDRYIVMDGVEVRKIGGHSVGSCIVELTKSGKTYVFCGDECYLRLCLERKIPTGASYSLKESQRFVESYGDPVYRILLCHDPEMKTGPID